MAQFKTSRRFDLFFLFTVTGFLIVASLFRQQIGDKVYFLTHRPSTHTLEIGRNAGLNSKGLHLLVRGNPVYTDLQTINKVCDVERLGCLTAHDQAYILDAPGKTDQTSVTAIHEMLHLAYSRLSASDKENLSSLLDQAIQMNLNNGLRDELSDLSTLSDRRDEAHSLLGTEYRNLPLALEQYYSDYFSDRTKILKIYVNSQQD